MQRQVAIIFPGQGSQTPGMRDSVQRERPDLLALARDLAGVDPFDHLTEGTRFVQPAIYCASIAGWERLGRPAPDLLAGHSLGEIAALVAAGALSAEDGLRIVALRGRLMQEAAAAGAKGGMLAVRATEDEIGPIAARCGVGVANVNDPRQVVLSGGLAALEEAATELGEAGVKTKLLPVAGAFHSRALEVAIGPFRAALDEVEITAPRVPVLRCATATPFEDVCGELAEALIRPVRWLDVMGALFDRGARRFIEPGPGKVLTGLVRRSLEGVEAEAPADMEVAGV